MAAKTKAQLTVKTTYSASDLTDLSPLATNGLALTIPSTSTSFGGTSTAIMKILASIDALSTLKGTNEVHLANVESWLTYGITNIEVPVLALKTAAASTSTKAPTDLIASIKKDLTHALSVINSHLKSSKYMVGDDVTIADIALVCALREAAASYLWDASSVDEQQINLVRWYSSIHSLDFFKEALAMLSQAGSDSADATATAATADSASGAVSFNGSPPAVVNQLYKRNRIRIKEILTDPSKYYGQTVTVAGWTRTVRKASSKLVFLEINDGSCGTSLQCICEATSSENFDESKQSGGTGSSFQLVGVVNESPAAGQAVELKVTKVKLLGAVYGGDPQGKTVGGMVYPMSKKEHTLEHLRQHAHLRPRAGLHAAAMRIRHCMAFATHKFFHDNGFLYIHTPIITCADCEGAGEQFGITTLLGADHHKPGVTLPVYEEQEKKELSKKEMKRLAKAKAQGKVVETEEDARVVGAVDYSKDFFGKRANLTVSGQLNVETHACALSDVYTFGPTFRAENSHTTRHLCEFWMIEPEIAFADLEDDINLAEDYLKYCVKYALEMCADDLEFFEKNPHGEVGLRDRLRNVLDNPFKVRI